MGDKQEQKTEINPKLDPKELDKKSKENERAINDLMSGASNKGFWKSLFSWKSK